MLVPQGDLVLNFTLELRDELGAVDALIYLSQEASFLVVHI
jgi:hypothetical protein